MSRWGSQREDVSPSFEDRIPAGLEISASDRVVDLGGTTKLRGELSRGGEPLDGETVRLEEDSYPFDRTYAGVSETTTDQAGRFSFT